MNALARIVTIISSLNTLVGRAFAWLALAAVLVCFTVAVQRYLFASTQIWMQDLYVWLNGLLFTAVAGFALVRDEHVRVDIFYRPARLRTKAWLDLFGVIVFLLPFCVVLWIYTQPYVLRSWALLEASPNPGGMPGLFVLKTFILLFLGLIGLQGIAMALRSILVLRGREDLLPVRYRYPQE